MAIVNHAKREINAKIVYFGAEGTGKATSLRYVYDRIKPSLRGELKTVPAAGSSLLFFDFSPFDQPVFAGYRLRLHIYTLQGKVVNPAAWKMTLKGADGIMVVAVASPADSRPLQQSLLQLREYLSIYGVGRNDVPMVLQFNKADLSGPIELAVASREAGMAESCACLTEALSGEGVLEALTTLSRLVMDRLRDREDMQEAEPRLVEVSGPQPQENPAQGLADPVKTKPPEPVPGADTVPVRIEVAREGASVNGTTVRIPLQLTGTGQVQHLVLTITVAPE